MFKLKQLSFIALAIIGSAQAHNRWILPSHFNVSTEKDGNTVWVMADVTASNETFNVDKGMGSDRFTIVKPDGNFTRPEASFRGHRKSVVDMGLTQGGTYKMFLADDISYWTTYEPDGEDKPKWVRNVNKLNRKVLLPKGAKNIKTTASSTQILTFVTVNEPTDNYKISNQGLELKPITHPSDIAQNEQATLQFLFDGKPQSDVKVTIIKDGVRYRNDPNILKLNSDSKGEISFELSDAGRYLLTAEYSTDKPEDPMADKVGGKIFFTFEAVLN